MFIHKQDLLPKKLKDEVNQTLEEYMLKDVDRIIRVFRTSVFNNSIFQAMDNVFREQVQIYEKILLINEPSKEDWPGIEIGSLKDDIQYLKDKG